MGLYELVYASTAVKKMDEQELLNMMKIIKVANKNHDITGMLLYVNGSFFQILEGEQQDVINLFVNIQHDARHRDVAQISLQPIDRRNLADWYMGFINLHQIEKENMPKEYIDILDPTVSLHQYFEDYDKTMSCKIARSFLKYLS